MKRENIFICENRTAKRIAATKFIAPGDTPAFDCLIRFGKEETDVTMQNCIIKDNLIVKCSPQDTYDFEMGALIALMKMCGVDKSYKAIEETFKYNSYDAKKSKELEKEKEELLDRVNYWKSQLNRLCSEKHRLEEENEKLKLDCEKLHHEMYGVYKESKEKTELPRTLDINGTVYRKSIQIKNFGKEIKPLHNDAVDSLIEQSRAFTRKCVDEWLYKIPTKREEMWNDILACDCEHSKYVKVKKEDLETFVKECNEKKIFNNIGYEIHLQEFWFADDSCIFEIFCKPAGFICAHRVSYVYKDTIIDYLPPMRWDLFKKGRRIIRVTNDNLDEFIVKCTNKFGGIMKPILKRYKDFTHVFVMISDYHYNNKPTVHIMTPEDLVRNQHENPKKYSDKKIVDWEDVR